MYYVPKVTPFGTFITGLYFDNISHPFFAPLDMTLFLFPYPTRGSWPTLVLLLAAIFRLMYTNEKAFNFFLIPLTFLFSIWISIFWHKFQSEKNEAVKYQERKIQFVKAWYTETAPKIMSRRSPSASQKYIFDRNRKRIAKFINEENKQNLKKKRRKPHRKKK